MMDARSLLDLFKDAYGEGRWWSDDQFTVMFQSVLVQNTSWSSVENVPVPCVHDVLSMSQEDLERIVRPCGFFHAKARHLAALPAVLRDRFGGRLPDTVEALCELPGVGRKTANLVVAIGFGKPAICVDTHVHRINNLLGVVRTKTPLETEMALRRRLPQRLWIPWNTLFVTFGQTLCKPVGPRCGACPVARFCKGPARKPKAPRAP